jgi:WD40 repeat protein
MLGVLGVFVLGTVLSQTREVPPRSNSNGPSAQQPAASQPATAPAESKIVSSITGVSVRTIACSEDGRLVAIANPGPTLIMRESGKSTVSDNWKPSAKILDARTGNTVVSLKLTTADEDAVIAETTRVSHFEVTALALAPDGSVVAVGTSIGQVNLYHARTGELIRSLDDEKEKLADTMAPDKWKSLKRAMGSVASLAFSPDGSVLAACGESFGDYGRVFDSAERLDERSTGPGRLKIWDVNTGAKTHDLVGHSDANAITFSPDGTVLASAGSWLSDSESGTGVVIWNAHTGTKLRTFVIDANAGTHSVAFSPDGKLLAISSLQFDKDKANDPGTSIISLAHVASGVMDWRRTLLGPVKPVAFQEHSVLVVLSHAGQRMCYLESKTGETLFRIIRSADPKDGGRWHDFAIAKRGRMQVTGGEDGARRGTVEILDPDMHGDAAVPAPAKGAQD